MVCRRLQVCVATQCGAGCFILTGYVGCQGPGLGRNSFIYSIIYLSTHDIHAKGPRSHRQELDQGVGGDLYSHELIGQKRRNSEQSLARRGHLSIRDHSSKLTPPTVNRSPAHSILGHAHQDFMLGARFLMKLSDRVL